MAALKSVRRPDSNSLAGRNIYLSIWGLTNEQAKTLVSDILGHLDCTIWYASEPITADTLQDHLASLSEMSLMVVPVTKALLDANGVCLRYEVPWARQHGLTCLPILLEPGLTDAFNAAFGSIEYLDRTVSGGSHIPYAQRLGMFLDARFAQGEEREAIRSTFQRHLFLSYRKKDRPLAHDLMRCIHEDPRCQGVAIWYDEFLTPGEDFNDNIEGSLLKSDLFLLAVTPSLLELPNYVQQIEYPRAQQEEKPVLPVELAPTDAQQMATEYRDLPECASLEDRAGLRARLVDLLGEFGTGPEGMSEEELLYLRGRAYLEGLDVEREPDIGAALVMRAAQAGYEPAMTRLSMLYRQGEGVERNLDASLQWERAVVSRKVKRYREAEASQDGASGDLVGDAYFGLWFYADDLLTLGDGTRTEAALKCYAMMRDIAEREREKCLNVTGALSGGLGFWARQIAICYNFEGDAHRSAGRYDLAIAANEESVKVINAARQMLGRVEAELEGSDDEATQAAAGIMKAMDVQTFRELLHDEAICYQRLGDLHALIGNAERADFCRHRSLELWGELRAAQKEGTKEEAISRDELVYNRRMGVEAMQRGDLETAERHLVEAYEMARALAYHDDAEARFDLATLTTDRSMLAGLQGKASEALAWAEQAVGLMESVLELDDSHPRHQFFAIVLMQMGDCQRALNDGRGATLSYCRAIDELHASVGGDERLGNDDKTTIKLCRLIGDGVMWCDSEDYELLLQELRRGVAAAERISAVEHDPQILRDVAAFRESMGHILKEQGKIKDARTEFGNSFDCWRLLTQLDNEDPTIWLDFAEAHLRVAEMESLDRDFMTARKTLQGALAILGKYLEMDASSRVRLAYSQACYSYGTLNMLIEKQDVGGYFARGWEMARQLVEEDPTSIPFMMTAMNYQSTWDEVSKK